MPNRYQLKALDDSLGRIGNIVVADTFVDRAYVEDWGLCFPCSMEAAKLIVEALNKLEESKNV